MFRSLESLRFPLGLLDRIGARVRVEDDTRPESSEHNGSKRFQVHFPDQLNC